MKDETQKIVNDLNTVYKAAIVKVDEGRKWYANHKKSPKRWSRYIRFTSIILIGLGGIFPLAQNLLKNNIPDIAYNLGYISIALAGTLIVLDRFFGFSSTWMRFTTSEVKFEKLIGDFTSTWETEMLKIDLCNKEKNELSCEKATELFILVQEFIKQAQELNVQDTAAWVTEFQSNISELQKLSDTKLESMKPGSIKVVIKDTHKYKDIKICVDGVLKKSNADTDSLVDNIRPGPHEVSLYCISVKDSKPVSKSSVVEVEANKMATTELSLPESEPEQSG